jgi:hypothetical protein
MYTAYGTLFSELVVGMYVYGFVWFVTFSLRVRVYNNWKPLHELCLKERKKLYKKAVFL